MELTISFGGLIPGLISGEGGSFSFLGSFGGGGGGELGGLISGQLIPGCLYLSCSQEGTGRCEALFDFEGDSSAGELSFVTGEMVATLEQVDKDWMKGRIGGREGIFPASFVKIITEIPVSPTKKTTIKPVSSGTTLLSSYTTPIIMHNALPTPRYGCQDQHSIPNRRSHA
jgi:hypothetical protein